jgi:hypothetical protein
VIYVSCIEKYVTLLDQPSTNFVRLKFTKKNHMKAKLLYVVTVACLLLFPIFSIGQTTVRPTMGTTENFVLFTSSGALTNTGASQFTLIRGDVGSDTAPLSTNLGNIDGTIFATGDTEGVTAQGSADLILLYNELYGLPQDYALPTLLGGPDALPPGVYSSDQQTTLDGNLILDASENPDALFIFRVTAPGTFSTTANSSIELINGAQACNVFWIIEGTVSIASGNIMKGNIVSAAAIAFAAETEFEGRALTKVGAITIDNGEIGFLAQKPIGCGSPALTGPTAPDLATAGCFALFTGDGSMGNSGTSTIVGDVGSNTAPPSGFDLPTTVDGTVHAIPNAETAQADLDLSNAFDYLDALPHDIVLLAPVVFGYGLNLTPNTYLLTAETHLTGDLYLDAQGNPDAVFIIKVDAAFFTAVDSKVLLINGAKSENVYWKVTGAVSIEGGTLFEGTIISSGAVELKSAVSLNGRVLTKIGNFSTIAISAISPGCGSTSAPEIITQPLDQVVCDGGSASFTVVATGTDLTYQWRKGIVELDDLTENISGATTATLTIDPASLSDAVSDYNVVVTGLVDPFTATSINVSLTVNTAPEITLQPTAQVGCIGAPVSFSVTAIGTDLTYQWRKGDVNLVDIVDQVSGVNTATLTIDLVSIDDIAENYNVVISGICAPDVTSNFASIVIGSAPEITLQPANQIGCEGASISFSVTATGTNLTYQWRKGDVNLFDILDNISGVNTATLTIDPVSITDAAENYNVVISGTCTPAAISDFASLVIGSAPAINLQPANQGGCVGSSISFSVEATGDDLTYQWRKGDVNLEDIVDHVSGVNTATLTINTISLTDAAYDYNVVVSGTCSPSIISNNVSLTVNSAPEITLQPTDQIGCLGSYIIFTVEATGAGLTYQWRKGEVDLEDIAGFVTGVNTATLTFDPVDFTNEADNYNVVISGSCAPSVTSDNVSLGVKTAPEITLQPANQTGCVGSSISFIVEATGTRLKYQWRKGVDELEDIADYISGVDKDTLIIDSIAVTDAAGDYNVVIWGFCAPSIISNNASLTVDTAPEITLQPANQIGCAGGSASFTVEATGAGLTYQWRKGYVNLTNTQNISGATSATLTIDALNDSDAASNYDVIVTGTCGSPVPSNNASLVVNISPEITEQPIDQTVNEGGIANFSVTATGTGITYQWRKGSVNLTNTDNILGVTSSALIIDPVSETDAAEDYNVVVSGSCDPEVISVNVALTVIPTGINVIDSENQLTLFPNPFTATVNIRVNNVMNGKKYELLIYNALGEIVARKTITEQRTSIETSHFASGVYFYQVIGNDKAIQSGKLIKQQ